MAVKGRRKARGLVLAGAMAVILAMAAAPASARPGHPESHQSHAHRIGHKVGR
jgi:hypothetical protein